MLDAVYINGAPCAGTAFSCSWGWRQSQPAATTPGGRVIALSTLLWNERSYSQYETELFQSVLPLPDAKYSKAQSCSPPTQNFENCSSVDTPTMALLAALAHEVGHVRWYDLVDTSFPGLNYPISYLCQGGVDFFDISWQTRGKPPAGNHGGEWRGLLVPSDQGRYAWKHLNPPQINAIDNAGQDKAKQVAKLFAPDTLHSEGEPWATALSAMAPDEDFIETYKFKVLISANKPLTSVNLAIPTATTTNYDIPLEYFTGYRSDLFAKVQCIASF
jgi:hypothetical protein